MKIDFYNIENIIFDDNNVRNILYRHKELLDSWVCCKINGDLSKINYFKITLLNSLTQDDLDDISNYYGIKYSLEKISNNIIGNFTFDLNNFNSFDIESYKDFCIFRDKYKLHLTSWR